MLPASSDTTLEYKTLDTRWRWLLVSLNAIAVPSAHQHSNVKNIIVGKRSEAAQPRTEYPVAQCKLDLQQHECSAAYL